MVLQRRKRPIRRGAALIEAAIILPVFLFLALGTIDLGMAVFMNHQVAQASRQAARIASVHGSLAPSSMAGGGPWGTAAYGWYYANNQDAITNAISGSGAFGVLNPSTTQYLMTWPQGFNNATSPYTPANPSYQPPGTNTVQVQVKTTWTPLFFYVFGNKTVTLSATSIMPIAH